MKMLKYFLLFLCTRIVVAQEPEVWYKYLQVFQKKCEENGVSDAFPQVQNANQVYMNCLRHIIDPQDQQKKIRDAIPKGQTFDVYIFKKLCSEKSDFKGCYQNMTATIKPCLTLEEKKIVRAMYNIFEQLVEFMCFKDDDRISLFYAQPSLECLEEKGVEIQKCLNTTLGYDFWPEQNLFFLDKISKIHFGEKQCGKFGKLQNCVVSSLESCLAPKFAKLIESLFKVVREASPCKQLEGPNSANTLTVKSVAMFAIIFSLIV